MPANTLSSRTSIPSSRSSSRSFVLSLSWREGIARKCNKKCVDRFLSRPHGWIVLRNRACAPDERLDAPPLERKSRFRNCAKRWEGDPSVDSTVSVRSLRESNPFFVSSKNRSWIFRFEIVFSCKSWKTFQLFLAWNLTKRKSSPSNPVTLLLAPFLKGNLLNRKWAIQDYPGPCKNFRSRSRKNRKWPVVCSSSSEEGDHDRGDPWIINGSPPRLYHVTDPWIKSAITRSP